MALATTKGAKPVGVSKKTSAAEESSAVENSYVAPANLQAICRFIELEEEEDYGDQRRKAWTEDLWHSTGPYCVTEKSMVINKKPLVSPSSSAVISRLL
ncbi:hypothetical protein HYALB_00013673 [Hymenoscyphus albidus]|uniref:Uncharacterized protein n=1 Tax=Hymenoscyphus albidus TaxID=595503 RepID=A0A9N9LWB8_9HELO|nr:hypothetical protein HYALB_00013673 [Hymenoscyphus albidus]